MIQVAQNACIRFISDLGLRDRISETQLRLGILRQRDKMRVKCLLFLHRLIYQSWMPSLLSTLHLVSNAEFRRGRCSASHRYVLPRDASKTGRCTFHFATIQDWNSLPNHIRQISRPIEFKRAVIAYFIHLDTLDQNGET